ncbi:hypothetical protein DAKH74_037610 [Maudiozyma humilis]|uniref:Uncharacterized protein n=1 Tax=Maudiozyma humilis TaxID=51915 RepID=A0AAV5RZW1_MAUHU|nr:hypothetical protein DAKH74_037610 [Kazachstania humilis]
MVTFNQLKEDTILGANELLTKNQLVQRHKRFVESSIHSLDILIDDLSDGSSKGERISTMATVPMSHFGITVSPTPREYATVVRHITRRINRSTGFSFVQKEYHERNDSNYSKHYGYVCGCKRCDRPSINPVPYAAQLYREKGNSQYGILLMDYQVFNGFINISLSHPGIHRTGRPSVSTETTSDSVVLVPQSSIPPDNATVIADGPSSSTETTSESIVLVSQSSTLPDKETVVADGPSSSTGPLSTTETASESIVPVSQASTSSDKGTATADDADVSAETTSDSIFPVPESSTPPDKEAVPEAVTADDCDGGCPSLSINITVSSEVDGYLLVDQQKE